MGNVTGGQSKAPYYNADLDQVVMESPLHKACRTGDQNLVSWYCTRGADRDAINPNGETPLHLAALGGHLKCVQLLLKTPRQVNIQDSSGYTAVHNAARSQRYAVLEAVLEQCDEESIGKVDSDGNNVLAHCLWSSQALRAALKKSGPKDLKVENLACYNLLHLAARDGRSAEVVGILIRRGLSPNSRVPLNAARNQNSTPMLFAVANDNVACLRVLRSHNVDMSCENAVGQGPLIIGAICDSAECVSELIKAGVDINSSDRKGKSALHYACESEYGNKAAKILVAAGANLSKRDGNLMTPLHVAAAGYRIDVCRQLVLKGADLDAADNTGMTPRDYFRSKDPDLLESMTMYQLFYRRRLLFMLCRRDGFVCDPPVLTAGPSKPGQREEIEEVDKENNGGNVANASTGTEMERVKTPVHPHLQVYPDPANPFLSLPRNAVYRIASYL